MTSQILAKYSNERGWVRLTVTDTVYSNQEKAFKKMDAFVISMQENDGQYWSKTVYDIDQAATEYRACLKQLRNRTLANMCTANPARRCACSPKNCPQEFGGAAFWQLFRASCLNRVK